MRCFLVVVLPAITSLAATINDFNIESNAVIPSEPSLPQQKKVRFVSFLAKIEALLFTRVTQLVSEWAEFQISAALSLANFFSEDNVELKSESLFPLLIHSRCVWTWCIHRTVWSEAATLLLRVGRGCDVHLLIDFYQYLSFYDSAFKAASMGFHVTIQTDMWFWCVAKFRSKVFWKYIRFRKAGLPLPPLKCEVHHASRAVTFKW